MVYLALVQCLSSRRFQPHWDSNDLLWDGCDRSERVVVFGFASPNGVREPTSSQKNEPSNPSSTGEISPQGCRHELNIFLLLRIWPRVEKDDSLDWALLHCFRDRGLCFFLS